MKLFHKLTAAFAMLLLLPCTGRSKESVFLEAALGTPRTDGGFSGDSPKKEDSKGRKHLPRHAISIRAYGKDNKLKEKKYFGGTTWV